MEKLKNLGVKNFRSFDEDGIHLDEIKRLNIFIGKNNSGKSTFLKFLKLLSENLQSGLSQQELYRDVNQHKGNKKVLKLTINLTHEELKFPKNLDRQISNPFKIEYDMRNNNIIKTNIFDNLDIQQLNKCIDINKNELAGSFNTVQKQQFIDDIERKLNIYINTKIMSQFKELIYIPHFRSIGSSLKNNLSEVDGSDIIEKMFKMQHPNIGHENKKVQFLKIEKFVKKLLKEQHLEIEVPHTKDDVYISMHGNRLPLDSYGTGIHQLIILCSALVINTNKIVCIEEPEVYLHPELQRMFLQFLIEETDNIYFITTHSNVFIDFNEHIQVNHVTHNGNATKIQQILELESSKEILDDLGYKNSDLLQSNGIIWVEGPSDRIYLNKWISLLTEDALKEGLHYSIMFYGGKLLSHIGAETKKSNNEFFENDLIDLMTINRNSFVIIDRDGNTSKTTINKTKIRIKEEFKEDKCWITKGREIENYLDANVIDAWLNSKKDKNKKIEYSKDEKLEESIENTGSKIKYANGKPKYSKEIVKYIIDKDGLDTLDLKEKLNSLISQIDKWNHTF